MNLDHSQTASQHQYFSVTQSTRQESLADCVNEALDHYFSQLGDHSASDLYHMVMEEVERPLFNSVMQYTQGNQTKAASVLGISRSTLRKKLALYGIG